MGEPRFIELRDLALDVIGVKRMFRVIFGGGGGRSAIASRTVIRSLLISRTGTMALWSFLIPIIRKRPRFWASPKSDEDTKKE